MACPAVDQRPGVQSALRRRTRRPELAARAAGTGRGPQPETLPPGPLARPLGLPGTGRASLEGTAARSGSGRRDSRELRGVLSADAQPLSQGQLVTKDYPAYALAAIGLLVASSTMCIPLVALGTFVVRRRLRKGDAAPVA